MKRKQDHSINSVWWNKGLHNCSVEVNTTTFLHLTSTQFLVPQNPPIEAIEADGTILLNKVHVHVGYLLCTCIIIGVSLSKPNTDEIPTRGGRIMYYIFYFFSMQ